MPTELQRLVETSRLSGDEITAKAQEIHSKLLGESSYLDQPNFSAVHPDDLERQFDLYDESFFSKQCRVALGDIPLFFRLSKRMTMAGGKTARYTPRSGAGRPFYEISVSTTLLFHTFQDVDRPIVVCGLPCRDRLEALQRVMEHELVHLIEMLVWTKSSCSAARFQTIASRFFGHTDHRHQLVTPVEKAITQFGIRPGDRVRFRFDGVEHVGKVNRISRRATVLVEDQRGPRYSDGKRYAKFYVPVTMLEPLK